MSASIHALHPPMAVGGGSVTIIGDGLPADELPAVHLGEQPARVRFASPSRIVITVPESVDGGRLQLRVSGVEGDPVFLSAGRVWATGLHQVDNPVFSRDGRLFVTYSGSRGQDAPVSVFRVTTTGTREPFASGIVNATSMTIGPDDRLYVASRFDGTVHRIGADGVPEQVASNLGVACGIAFDSAGVMYVGDRSGTIFTLRDGKTTVFATLPASIAAFHLAISPTDELFVSAPTLSSYDHIFRIDQQGTVRMLPRALGRPQGLTFSPDGVLHVIDALAGASGLYRFADLEGEPELVVSGNALVGVAFGPAGELAVTSNDTAYRFDPVT